MRVYRGYFPPSAITTTATAVKEKIRTKKTKSGKVLMPSREPDLAVDPLRSGVPRRSEQVFQPCLRTAIGSGPWACLSGSVPAGVCCCLDRAPAALWSPRCRLLLKQAR